MTFVCFVCVITQIQMVYGSIFIPSSMLEIFSCVINSQGTWSRLASLVLDGICHRIICACPLLMKMHHSSYRERFLPFAFVLRWMRRQSWWVKEWGLFMKISLSSKWWSWSYKQSSSPLNRIPKLFEIHMLGHLHTIIILSQTNGVYKIRK